MVTMVFAVLALSFVLLADFAWAGFRDWRHRRIAIKTGPTLTRKFSLPFD